MAEQDLCTGLIRLHVLHHASAEVIFGLGMIAELQRHGYRVGPGTLYPMLHEMERRGILKSKVNLAEAFKPVSKKLSFYAPTGDLSGKSILAVAAWLVAWAILHIAWKQRDIEHTGKILTIVLLLILFSLVATFPPFFGLFAAD